MSVARAGVDTGGTFTDFVLLEGNRLAVHKVRTTPDDPSRAILDGLAHLLDGARPAEVVHGSTVATNAVLERRGARLALVTTAGFEDVLRIGRQTRRRLYDFMVDAPEPLVPEALTFGVPERVAADGSVVLPLDERALDAIVASLRAADVEAVAVCFLHAYRNPEHERAAAARLRSAGFTVSASHEILSEYRELERWSTTALNAYVAPLMRGYLSRLQNGLRGSRLRVMGSNGGSMSAETAGTLAVRTILSGPAAGAVGAFEVARASGFDRVIGLDMGGTSTDVTLMDGRIATTDESEIDGLPLRLPVVDIHTVGAGGGSIAWIDAAGGLRVGPRSAGAVPGPACYGDSNEATVTDANLVLGRIDPSSFLGGRMRLDVARARDVLARLGSRLGLSVEAAAWGIVRVANASMTRAIRVVSVERGFDPRRFALVAFGGAGAGHACDLALALDIPTVLVPKNAGVLSALGMLLADTIRDYSHTLLASSRDLTHGILEERFAPLAAEAVTDLRAEGCSDDRMVVERLLDLRYVGQGFEIAVPFDDRWQAAFHEAHGRRYGYADEARPLEVVTLRVRAIGLTDKPVLPRAEPQPGPLPAARTIETWFDGRPMTVPLVPRGLLRAGMRGHGPCVIPGDHETTVVGPQFSIEVDPHEALILRRDPASGGESR